MTDRPELCPECAKVLRELVEDHERELAVYQGLFSQPHAVARIYEHFFKRVKDMVAEK